MGFLSTVSSPRLELHKEFTLGLRLAMRLPNVAAWTLMVSLAAHASGQSTPRSFTFKQVTRIDGSTESLSAISWIAVSQKGVVAVLQPQDKEVLFFGPGGKRIGSFGRAGEGPGEFRAMGNAGWIGDTLWVRDYGKRKLIFMNPRQKLLREVPDTAVALGDRDKKLPCSARIGGMDAVNPYCAGTVTHWSEDSGFVVTVSQQNPKSAVGAFTVTLQKHQGDTVFVSPQTMRSVRITPRFTDSVMAILGKRLPPDIVTYLRSSMPQYFAPVQIARVGTDGTVWLRLSPDPSATTVRYMVLGSKGALIGTAVLARQIVVYAVSRERIWAVETDSNGIESVVVLTVVK